MESEVLAALNRARTNPVMTASDLEALLPYFNGKLLRPPAWPVAVQTVEGAAAVREASAALRAQTPVASLTASAILARAARDHVVDQGRTGATGHTGSDGSTTASRVARYATWQISLSENIDYGAAVSGTDVVQSLLIDDGVRDRGHRHNIYDSAARVAGIACGPHPTYRTVCVIIQAGGVVQK